jgi:hypothetical protein
MLELARLLALVAFIALALALLLFLRRAGRLLTETRKRQQFRRTATDLVARSCQSLDGLAERVDGVRRQTLAVQVITANIEAADEALRRYAVEADALVGSTAATREVRDGIVAELDRAARALQMVEHGCAILAVSRRASGRELEAQTAVKRGYLGILHAREALARHGARATELATVDPARLFDRRNADGDSLSHRM